MRTPALAPERIGRRARLRTAWAIWALSAVAAAKLPAQPSVDDAWLRAETRSFTLVSNAAHGRTVEVARRLEEFRSALERLHGGSSANAPVPTKVYVFRDGDSFAPYKPRHEGRPAPIAGYFQSGSYGNVVALDGSRRRGSTEVIFHEALHAFAHDNFPGAPLWFEEGLAELYSTFETDGRVALLGRPRAEHVAWLRRNRLIPMQEFLAVDRASELYDERRRQGVFYAQAWALVHYFLAGDEGRRRQVGRYLDLLAGDRSELLLTGADVELPDREAAFREAFDLSYLELERELESYVERATFDVFSVRLDLAPEETWVRVAPLGRAEVLYELGDLLARQRPARESEARRLLEAALAIEPAHGHARAVLGLLEEAGGNLAAAVALFESAVELLPNDALPRFHLGRALLREAVERVGRNGGTVDPEDRELIARARSTLEESRYLDPELGPVHAVLGYTYLFDRPPLEEGLAILLEARRRMPGSTDVLLHLAVLAARLGRVEGARRLVDELLVRSRDPEQLDAARLELAKAELQVAIRLLEERRADEALALAEATLARADAEVARRIAPMVEQLQLAADELALIDRYDLSLELLRAGRHAQALEEIRGVAGAARDRELRERASRLESELRHLLATEGERTRR